MLLQERLLSCAACFWRCCGFSCRRRCSRILCLQRIEAFPVHYWRKEFLAVAHLLHSRWTVESTVYHECGKRRLQQ